MGPISVVVQDSNNLTLEVTPTASTTVILDRGIPGPVGPMGDGDVTGPTSSINNGLVAFNGTTGKLIKAAATVTIAQGGTGATTRQNAMDALAGSTTSGQYLRGNGTDVVMSAIQAADVPTLNQNTTGTANNVTGIVAVANGGTGLSLGISGGILAFTATGTLVSSAALEASKLVVGGGAGVAPSTITTGNGVIGALGNNLNGINGLVTSAGTATLTNKTIEAGIFTNGYTEEVVTANTGTAYTIDLANGSVQILTLTGNVTFTFPTATAGSGLTILLKQDATGSRTVTWPASVKWPSNIAPTITATASKADKYVFVADGTYWVGSNAGQNYTL